MKNHLSRGVLPETYSISRSHMHVLTYMYRNYELSPSTLATTIRQLICQGCGGQNLGSLCSCAVQMALMALLLANFRCHFQISRGGALVVRSFHGRDHLCSSWGNISCLDFNGFNWLAAHGGGLWLHSRWWLRLPPVVAAT